MKRLISNLRSSRFKYLIDFLAFLAFAQAAIFILGVKAIFPEPSEIYDTVVRFSAFILFFLFGCASFVGMIRQEFRQVIPIKGKVAQVIGLFLWIFSWGLDIYIISTLNGPLLR